MVVAGCGQGGAGDLSGRTFVSLASDRGKQLVAGSSLRLTFESGEVRAHAGCNSLTGKLELDGDRLVVSDLAGTLMACSAELMEQEEWLRTFLLAGPRWRLDAALLELSDGATRVLLTES